MQRTILRAAATRRAARRAAHLQHVLARARRERRAGRELPRRAIRTGRSSRRRRASVPADRARRGASARAPAAPRHRRRVRRAAASRRISDGMTLAHALPRVARLSRRRRRRILARLSVVVFFVVFPGGVSSARREGPERVGLDFDEASQRLRSRRASRREQGETAVHNNIRAEGAVLEQSSRRARARGCGTQGHARVSGGQRIVAVPAVDRHDAKQAQVAAREGGIRRRRRHRGSRAIAPRGTGDRARDPPAAPTIELPSTVAIVLSGGAAARSDARRHRARRRRGATAAHPDRRAQRADRPRPRARPAGNTSRQPPAAGRRSRRARQRQSDRVQLRVVGEPSAEPAPPPAPPPVQQP